jgi:hypothetical protein
VSSPSPPSRAASPIEDSEWDSLAGFGAGALVAIVLFSIGRRTIELRKEIIKEPRAGFVIRVSESPGSSSSWPEREGRLFRLSRSI